MCTNTLTHSHTHAVRRRTMEKSRRHFIPLFRKLTTPYHKNSYIHMHMHALYTKKTHTRARIHVWLYNWIYPSRVWVMLFMSNAGAHVCETLKLYDSETNWQLCKCEKATTPTATAQSYAKQFQLIAPIHSGKLRLTYYWNYHVIQMWIKCNIWN